MGKDLSLEALWEATPPGEGVFAPERVAGLPAGARRYLEHAIAPGTPLARAVRLRMRGEIKLRGWFPFTAEQVIHRERGMIWRATTRVRGLPITGADRFVDGEGAMRWRLLGLFPVVNASGPDVSRSAAGRVAAEMVWLPSALLGEAVSWSEPEPLRPRARFTLRGYPAELGLTLDDAGRLREISLPRWGDPDGGTNFRCEAFGGVAEAEGVFGGYTIPTRLRVGWYYGTERFAAEGEFFRVTVTEATFR